jgi:hypothetical protein
VASGLRERPFTGKLLQPRHIPKQKVGSRPLVLLAEAGSAIPDDPQPSGGMQQLPTPFHTTATVSFYAGNSRNTKPIHVANARLIYQMQKFSQGFTGPNPAFDSNLQ